jgi:NAD(P)-dependent dehydrogenase (short-subunit alcohol dehydrogenase family)
MESFEGRLAVVTGGGTGMGRELVHQLSSEGCSVATCDVNPESLAASVESARAAAAGGVTVTGHACDVSDEAQVQRFRDEVVRDHDTDHVDLLFNNAGIGGGGSFVADERESWERTFGVCWGGVYNCSRAFVPLLVASERAWLVNTSSVNGFWASLGPGSPHTAYSTAKFAVKGFTEALIEDFRVHAPHVQPVVVMPGHIGTDIVLNSMRAHGNGPDDMTAEQLDDMRADMAKRGVAGAADLDDDAVRGLVRAMGEGFRNSAPLDAAAAARIILDGVRAGQWRILVGDDARALDEMVRAAPESAYDTGGGFSFA